MRSNGILATTLLVTAATLASAPAAHADEPVAAVASPFAKRAVRVDAGAGSAVGFLGVVWSRPQSERFAYELGVGLGLSGVQASAMGRLRLGQGDVRFTPGVGLSLGMPMLSAFSGDLEHVQGEPTGGPSPMLWADLDVVGLELRTRGGFVLSASAGLNVAITPGHFDVGDIGGNVNPGDFSPQARLGMGWTF